MSAVSRKRVNNSGVLVVSAAAVRPMSYGEAGVSGLDGDDGNGEGRRRTGGDGAG